MDWGAPPPTEATHLPKSKNIVDDVSMEPTCQTQGAAVKHEPFTQKEKDKAWYAKSGAKPFEKQAETVSNGAAHV